MTLKSVMLQLDVAQIERLDREAARAGVSRSHLIRQAVDAAFSPPIDHDLAARYAAAYPDGGIDTDEWGNLDEWHAAAGRDRIRSAREPW
jgi:hypothetical protein